MNGGTRGLTGFVGTYLVHRYTILFYTLLFTFVSLPILSSLQFSGTLLEWILAASLLAAILPVDGVRNRPWLSVAFLLIWIARPLTHWYEHGVTSAVILGIWTFIGLVAAAAALRFAMRATRVDAEH